MTATTTTAPALRVSDAVLDYPDGDGALRALDEVSLELHAGTLTALTGPSGSGKSSLLAVAAGLICPTSGSVQVAGRELAGLAQAQRTRLRGTQVAVVFQQPTLLASLTAREQLELTVRLHGSTDRAARRQARRRAEELLDRVGLADHAHRRPHQLSGGQRQRVNIARALMGSPALLLADEPTAALDQERSAQIVELLASLTREAGTATLMVTHDESSLERTDAHLRMVDGRLSGQTR